MDDRARRRRGCDQTGGWSADPQPSTLHLRSSTLNPILNPRPSTLNHARTYTCVYVCIRIYRPGSKTSRMRSNWRSAYRAFFATFPNLPHSSLSHTHTNSLSPPHTLSLSLSLSHSHTHTLSLSLYLFPSYSLPPCQVGHCSIDESTGVPRSLKNSTPWDTTVGPRLGSYGGPRGWAFSYERGTPVPAFQAVFCRTLTTFP